jgi:aspartate carbamoyltransferase catalytic subunit
MKMQQGVLATLYEQDIIHGGQFDRDTLDALIDLASYFRSSMEKKSKLKELDGYILATLFFEPSTRTRLSFETAMQRLGGSIIGFASADATSTQKGESLSDTVRTVDQYADAIVIRHPQIGSANTAAQAAEHPIINGGDGAGQHPTQALLDLFTIYSECGSVDGKTLLLCGDLKHGRTIHAGVELYKHYKTRLLLVSPEELALPPEIIQTLKEYRVEFEEGTSLEESLPQADVVYMTRVQKERFQDANEYMRYKDRYILTREMVEQINPRITILHPLPRINEIEPGVDSLSNAAYFRQVKNGVLTRMALLLAVLKEDIQI